MEDPEGDDENIVSKWSLQATILGKESRGLGTYSNPIIS